GPTLINNTIADNDGGSQGSAVLVDNRNFNLLGRLTNNVIVSKTGQAALLCLQPSSSTLQNFDSNDVFAPSGIAYGGSCANQTGINGNISANPLFVDSANANYHLRVGSATVDAGNNLAPTLPVKDMDGDNRILNATGLPTAVVDMGADELANAQVLVLSSS